MNNTLTIDHVKALRDLLRTKSDGELRRMYDCLMRDNAHHIGAADLENASQIYAKTFPDNSVPAPLLGAFGGAVRQNARSSRPARSPSRPPARSSPKRPGSSRHTARPPPGSSSRRPPATPYRPSARPSPRAIPDEYVIPIILISCIAIFLALAYAFSGTIYQALAGRSQAEKNFLNAITKDKEIAKYVSESRPKVALDRWEEAAFWLLKIYQTEGRMGELFDDKFYHRCLKRIEYLSRNMCLQVGLNWKYNLKIERAIRDMETEIITLWHWNSMPHLGNREIECERDADQLNQKISDLLNTNQRWVAKAMVFYQKPRHLVPTIPDQAAVIQFVNENLQLIRSFMSDEFHAYNDMCDLAIRILSSMMAKLNNESGSGKANPDHPLIMFGMSRFLARALTRMSKPVLRKKSIPQGADQLESQALYFSQPMRDEVLSN